MSLEILYEDNHLIVVVKPVGVLSQADNTKDMDMLTLIKYYLRDRYQKSGNVYLGLVHRLDRMTGGVMVFAKTSKAASRLSKQIQNKIFQKKYYAIVQGNLKEDGKLIDYLIKDEKERKAYIGNKNSGKLAELEYHIVKQIQNETLVDIKLLTGRYHQIRAQFSHLGYPLVGDTLYGNSNQKLPIKLYAYEISFNHPITNETLVFHALPTDYYWQPFFKH